MFLLLLLIILFNGKISELNFIKISITIGENINLPISANIVSLSNFILFSPALCKTIPMYIRDSGVTIPPKYPNVELIKAGTGILKNKKIRATIKPNNGGGNSFFQLKVAPCLSLSLYHYQLILLQMPKLKLYL